MKSYSDIFTSPGLWSQNSLWSEEPLSSMIKCYSDNPQWKNFSLIDDQNWLTTKEKEKLERQKML